MGTAQAGTFDYVLEQMRRESRSTVELGTKFENLVKDFLETDSVYHSRFKKVLTWREYAKEAHVKYTHLTAHDLGIDLVAYTKTNDLCAIQCKCNSDDVTLKQEPIDSFISAATSHGMHQYILACTGPIGPNASSKLTGVKCTILTPEILRNSTVDWSTYPKITRKKPKVLRNYQENALADVVHGFEENDRGKLIMACGTGKTLVALHVAEQLTRRGGLVLYLVPSISLILQSMREWAENANIDHYYMAVCSDRSVGNDEGGTLTELEVPASTSVEALKAGITKIRKDALNVIFSTYNSIDVVKDATRGRTFDIAFCDEAHRTASIKETGRSEPFYSRIHDDHNIRASRRLYMTATPRIYSANVKVKAEMIQKEVLSMDDEEIFGPIFHNLTFHDAVHKYGALCDFKIIVTEVSVHHI